jgi:hypothetical protein
LKKTILLVVAKRCDAKAKDYGTDYGESKKNGFLYLTAKCGLKFAYF